MEIKLAFLETAIIEAAMAYDAHIMEAIRHRATVEDTTMAFQNLHKAVQDYRAKAVQDYRAAIQR